MGKQSVAITQCGTFALIGSSKGNTDMYNLQSGYHRQRYPAKSTMARARMQRIAQGERPNSTHRINSGGQMSTKSQAGGHPAILGIAVDSLNRTVICCTRNGIINVWGETENDYTEQLC